METISKYKLSGYDELKTHLEKDIKPGFVRSFLDSASNHETSFFRDPKFFNVLEKSIFPQLFELKNEISILSCGCSSGQEVYSLAMILEDLVAQDYLRNYSVKAVDISAKIIKKAKEGVYLEHEVVRGLDSVSKNKFFTFDGRGQWQVKPALKAKISFSEFNLLDPLHINVKYDLIMCRNVLIYHSKENKFNIITRLVRQLNPGGILVIGSTEGLGGSIPNLYQVIDGGAIYFKLK